LCRREVRNLLFPEIATAGIFFQPGHLRDEPADLSVEFFELFLVGRLFCLALALSPEERRQAQQRQGFPLADL
jgi:hypothetical protein